MDELIKVWAPPPAGMAPPYKLVWRGFGMVRLISYHGDTKFLWGSTVRPTYVPIHGSPRYCCFVFYEETGSRDCHSSYARMSPDTAVPQGQRNICNRISPNVAHVFLGSRDIHPEKFFEIRPRVSELPCSHPYALSIPPNTPLFPYGG